MKGTRFLSNLIDTVAPGHRLTSFLVAKNGGRKNSKKSGSKQRKKVHAAHGGLQPDTDMMSLFAGLLQKSADEDGVDEDGGVTFSFIQDEMDEEEIDPGLDKWIPAFFTKADAAAGRVVDPTGGGNTFLGGLGVALARGKTMEEAACWGSIAASFAIEQVGVPELCKDADGEEKWNGDRVQDRLDALQARLALPAE
jgi:hypothetical protein